MPRKRYLVTLAGQAERDLDHILLWTRERFGARQAEIYASTIRAAFETLSRSVTPPGSKEREEIGVGHYSLHVARSRRRGRHFLCYRQRRDGEIVITRILHDSMDIARQMRSNDVEE